MTDIRKAAEEWLTNYHGSIDATAIIMAHMAGAKRMREQAAQKVERAHAEIPYTPSPGESAVTNPPMRRISDIAAAIRKIGENDD